MSVRVTDLGNVGRLARITLVHGQWSRSFGTDKEGRFSTVIPCGTYSIKIEKKNRHPLEVVREVGAKPAFVGALVERREITEGAIEEYQEPITLNPNSSEVNHNYDERELNDVPRERGRIVP